MLYFVFALATFFASYAYCWNLEESGFLRKLHSEELVWMDACFVKDHLPIKIDKSWEKWMEVNKFFDFYVPPEEHIKYRYLISAEGDSLEWQLFSDSLILKQQSKKQSWLCSRLNPYIHYVPFREDSADLADKVLWLKENDGKACEIARNAKKFARENLSDEMAFLYMYKLLSAYALLQR